MKIVFYIDNNSSYIKILLNYFSKLSKSYYKKFKILKVSNVKHLVKQNNINLIIICPIRMIKPKLVKYLNKYKKIRKILYNLDGLILKSMFKKHIKLLNKINNLIIWEYSKLNFKILYKLIDKNNIKYIPCSLTYSTLNLDNEKTIDVLFYGKMNDRRINLYNKLKELENINVIFNDKLSGKRKNNMLKKCKIALIINKYDYKIKKCIPKDFFRLSYLVDNNIFTLTENCNENEGYKDLTILTDYDDFIPNILKYLKLTDKERLEIAKKNRENYRKKYSMKSILSKKYINSLLKKIE